MADVATWMPFYIGDYLGDTQRLTTEQHGAYILLILDYWRNGPAPDDDDVLIQITKLERARWKKHRAVLSKLFRIENGEWRHKRIDEELVNARSNADRRSAKAKAAAEARWGNAPSNAPSMPQALLGECPPPSPSPSPSEEGEEESNKYTSLHPNLAFSGRVIRLNKRDFEEWQNRYSAIADLRAELGALDDWLRGQRGNIQDRWFHVVSAALSKKHQAQLIEARKGDDAEPWEFAGPC